ncbi:hypothetical protein GGR52DRAFT_570947 [Hypoxylon sp. FL1284]|nr:hypothetical protein GGR52DRAFT_570947 [Hypoxylon sp. FL1284]
MAQTIKGAAHIGPSPLSGSPSVSKWSSRYRGATVQDLEPPSALSLNPSDPISLALNMAFERDYTHLTVVDADTRALVGYIAIPALQAQLDAGRVRLDDPLSRAMTRFERRGKKYKVITLDTTLEELEEFFEGGGQGAGGGLTATGTQKQDFAVVTDEDRRFVLGVATRSDLEEFVKRRPA